MEMYGVVATYTTVQSMGMRSLDTYCTDFLPLSVQLGLLLGLVAHSSPKTTCLSSFTHLHPVLKGSPEIQQETTKMTKKNTVSYWCTGLYG